jgi:hypothetical protein
MNDCDILWSRCVKIRAHNKCEISGGVATNFHLESHHVFGKSTPALRYDLRGGICLTFTIHEFKMHSTDPKIANKYNKKAEERLIAREGKQVIEELKALKNQPYCNLRQIKKQLQDELKRLQENV